MTATTAKKLERNRDGSGIEEAGERMSLCERKDSRA